MTLDFLFEFFALRWKEETILGVENIVSAQFTELLKFPGSKIHDKNWFEIKFIYRTRRFLLSKIILKND